MFICLFPGSRVTTDQRFFLPSMLTKGNLSHKTSFYWIGVTPRLASGTPGSSLLTIFLAVEAHTQIKSKCGKLVVNGHNH
jgi:hypothetical protein